MGALHVVALFGAFLGSGKKGQGEFAWCGLGLEVVRGSERGARKGVGKVERTVALVKDDFILI